jgi:hypothetical protein
MDQQMPELIAIIVLIISLSGIGIIVYRKMPLLLELPKTVSVRFNWKEQLARVKNFSPLKDFSFEVFLQKILSRVRVLTLKTDNKTSSWLQRLREKSQKNKIKEEDNYWEKVKKSTKE